MAKAMAIIADVNPHEEDLTKLRITLAVSVRPDTGQTFVPFKIESLVIVSGSENAQQLNAAILSRVKADALEVAGVTLSDFDIVTTKFT